MQAELETKSISEMTAVIRIHHSVEVIEGCAPKKDHTEEMIDISMFKTIKITGMMSSAATIDVLAQKLQLTDRENFSLYSLDPQLDNIKRKLEPEEKPIELVINDVSKKLKLVVLHKDEAAKFTGAAKSSLEFYTLAGRAVVGPYPRPRDALLPYQEDVLRHRKCLNPDAIQFMNLTFILEGGKVRMFSHRCIIEVRCPSLLLAVNLIKKKKEKKGALNGPMTIEYKDGTIMNMFVLTQILEWCYTSKLDFSYLSLPDVMVILKASQELDIPHLRFVCDQYIRSELTIDTSFVIIKQATLLDMKDMLSLATDFAHAKWAQFTANKEGMEVIGIELFMELTIAMNQRSEPSTEEVKDATAVKDVLVNDFRSIYKEGRFFDAEMVVPATEEGGGEAQRFKFHKAIVAVYSKPLFNMISTQAKVKEFTLVGLSAAAVSDLLEFIYFGSSDMDPVGACEIIEHAMVPYSLHNIREAASISIAQGITVENAIPILRLTYLPQSKHRSMVNLRESVLQFLCKNFHNAPIPTIRSLEHSHFGNNLMADVLDAFFYYHNPGARALYDNSSLKIQKRKTTTITHTESVPVISRKARSHTKM